MIGNDIITAEQVKAARALLRLTASEVATSSGVLVSTISRVEAFKLRLTTDVASKLFRFFTESGIEFIGQEGVRNVELTTRTFRGSVAIQQHLETLVYSIQQRASHNQKTILRINNVDETLFVKQMQSYSKVHIQKMNDLFRNGHLESRILIRDRDNNPMGVEYGEYKSIPSEYFIDHPYYVWGDKVVIILSWKPTPLLFSVQNINNAETYKKNFDLIWDKIATKI